MRVFVRTLAFLVACCMLVPAFAQAEPDFILPDPPQAMALPEGDPTEQAIAFADAIEASADGLDAWLGMYDALGIPVIGPDGVPIGSTGDDPIGPKYYEVWYFAGGRAGSGIPLSDSARLLALGLEDEPYNLEQNATLGTELAENLLRGLKISARGSDPKTRLLGYFVRERVLRGPGHVDVLAQDATADAAIIDVATFNLLRWAFLREALFTSPTTSQGRGAAQFISYRVPDVRAAQGGSSPCSGVLGDEDVTYWVNWIANKASSGIQLPGMQQAFKSVVERIGEKLGVAESKISQISKAVNWANVGTAAISLIMQLAALDVGFNFEPEKLIRTKTTDAGASMTIFVALESNPENLPDGNGRAACFASIILNALGVSFSFPAGGRIAGAEMIFDGGANFPEKVLFGNYMQIKQDTNSNGEVQLDVIGVAQEKDLPESVTPVEDEFSVIISAQPEAVTGNTIANIFFGGLTFGVAPTASGASGSVIDILKTFRYEIGEFFFPLVDWRYPGYTASGGAEGLVVSGLVCDLAKPFTLMGTVEGGSITLSYTPSDAKAGQYSYTGAAANAGTLSGEGTYTIADRGDTLLLTQSGRGCVMGGSFCASGVENITLTPVEGDVCEAN